MPARTPSQCAARLLIALGGLLCGGCAAADDSAPQPAPLVSRTLAVEATSGNAADAISARPGSGWRSHGIPATLTVDLTPLLKRNIHRVLLVWYNDATYGYDHRLIGQTGYNNLGTYSIELSSSPEDPAAWVPVVKVADNTRHSRTHVIETGNASRLRLRIERSDGSPGNADASAHLDLYDATAGGNEGWLFVGDSVTANGLGHEPIADTGSFANELERSAGVFPPQENAGMPGWTLADVGKVLPGWLDDFPGQFVPLAFGTNDAASGIAPEQFGAQLQALLQLIVARGKTPIVPSIPWSADSYHAARIPALNEQIARVAGKVRGARQGPDLFTLFKNRPALISPDGIHPTAEGAAALRKAWADWAVREIYRKDTRPAD